MHNAAIAALELPYAYLPFSVEPGNLGPALKSLPKLGIAGVNLTIPHKESAIRHMDELSAEARAVGAVNTVHAAGERLLGCNTDGDGFMAPLNAIGFRASGARVLILGAGGAARSVVYRLAREGAAVTIANRTPARAEQLREDFRHIAADSDIEVVPLDDTLRSEAEAADLVVNTTPIGMHPRADGIPPIPMEALHAGQVVYDLVYRPLETQLLRSAAELGAQTVSGLAMLIHQGAESFKIWTGLYPPVDEMERAALAELSA
jgi:shikimate dehydrogenase